MSISFDLGALEAIVDDAEVSADIEAAMPSGGRPRQLPVRTLLLGIAAAIADDRPGHLRRVHRALLGLPAGDQARLGVVVVTRRGPHTLTYRQVERTFSSMVRAMDAEGLTTLCDRLVEASVPVAHKADSTSHREGIVIGDVLADSGYAHRVAQRWAVP